MLFMRLPRFVWLAPGNYGHTITFREDVQVVADFTKGWDSSSVEYAFQF
jgi:hypothetical protein